MKKYFYFLLIVFAFANDISAQYAKESKVVLQTSGRDKKMAEAENFYGVLTFSTGTNQLMLRLNMSDFTFIDYRKDSIFNTYIGKTLTYRATLPGNIFDIYKAINDGKEYELTGELTVDNTTVPCNAVFDPINVTDKNNNNTLRLDLVIPIDPLKMNITLLKDHFKNSIELSIIAGSLNITN